MRIARVIGNVVATVKDARLAGQKLLLIEPLAASGKPAPAVVALDSVGAGVGEWVYFCRGKEASFALPGEPPTETTITGILDPASNRGLAEKFMRRG